jgi:hypothetical protein
LTGRSLPLKQRYLSGVFCGGRSQRLVNVASPENTDKKEMKFAINMVIINR